MKILVILLLFTTTAFAKEFAAGLILGTPTGLSGKYQETDRNAYQLDFSTGYAAIDYLWYDSRNFDVDELKWFYGAGAVATKGIGARGITGVEYNLKDIPFHLLGNISYAVISEKNLSQYVGIAFGARYDF